jgi:hypothetical protein
MRHFFSKIREELLALLILVPLAIVLGLVLYSWPVTEQPGKEISTPLPVASQPLSSATPSLLPIDQNIAGLSATANQSAITLVIRSAANEPTSYQVSVTEPITVADLLKSAQPQGLQFSAEDYGAPLGLLVTSLNSLANNQQKKMYWYFYVNGNLSSAGASTTKVAPGDTVEWRYELAQEYENN